MLDCFEAVLNGYLRNDKFDVFVTVSNAKFLSKDIITEFSDLGLRNARINFRQDEYGILTMNIYDFLLTPQAIEREHSSTLCCVLPVLFFCHFLSKTVYLLDIIKYNQYNYYGQIGNFGERRGFDD